MDDTGELPCLYTLRVVWVSKVRWEGIFVNYTWYSTSWMDFWFFRD